MGKMGMSLTCSQDRRKPNGHRAALAGEWQAPRPEGWPGVRSGEPCRDRFGVHCKSSCPFEAVSKRMPSDLCFSSSLWLFGGERMEE